MSIVCCLSLREVGGVQLLRRGRLVGAWSPDHAPGATEVSCQRKCRDDLDGGGVGETLAQREAILAHPLSHAATVVPPGVALGQAVPAIQRASDEIGMPSSLIGGFQGNAQAFQAALGNEPILIAASLVVVYVILGVLYESYIHPLTILSTLPSAGGVGALLALWAGGFDLSVIGGIGIILLIGIVKKNGIILVDFAISRERAGACAASQAVRQACRVSVRS